jgi:hypothetical protein
MERNEENTQKLIKFYTLYEKISFGGKYEKRNNHITEDYVWKKFNLSRNYKLDWENRDEGNGTIHDFIEGEFMLDPIFKPYNSTNFSFLKPYPKNIRELIVKQIILDTRKLDFNLVENLFYILDETGKKQPPKRDPNDMLREDLHKLINNIDEFIIFLEFIDNPPKPLFPLHKEKVKKVQLKDPYTQEEIDEILRTIDYEYEEETLESATCFNGR